MEKEEPLFTVGRSVPGVATVEISALDSQETQTRAAIWPGCTTPQRTQKTASYHRDTDISMFTDALYTIYNSKETELA